MTEQTALMIATKAPASQRWRRLIPLAFVRKEFAKLLERRLHYLHRTVAPSPRYRVLAGVHKLLRVLGQGLLLGIVTANLEATAQIKLHRARLNCFFSLDGYGSDSTDGRQVSKIALDRVALVYGEAVSAQQASVVGDTSRDALGARASGMKCIGVASHHYDAQQLRQPSADYAIASLQKPLAL
jgi:phosphoglycolate phosphatase